MKKLLVILLFMLGGISYANSQALTQICFRNTNGGCSEVTALNPFPVTGTITASLGGFNLESSLTPLSVTTSSGTSGSFTAGKTLILSNVGTTNTAYCKLGTGATTSSTPILPGQSINFTSIAETTIACITSSSTTTVNIQVGTGLPTGWGGSGSGGGGGAVTIADGADVTLGAIADAAATAGGTGTLSAKLRLITSQLSTISTNTSAAIPAGSALIGLVTPNDGTNSVLFDPCQTVAKTVVPISQTANTKIISATSAKKNYICSITLIAGAAEIVNIVEGTGTTCGSSTAAIVGSTTASQGLSFAANGGMTLGNGGNAVIAGIGTNVDTCLTQSGSSRVSGFITYVQR